MRVYISGMVSGLPPHESFSNFILAEAKMEADGNDVVNPLRLTHNHDKSWNSYMKEDIIALLDCDSIYMIEGWERSQGARLEHHIAKEFDMNIIYERT